MIKSEELYEQTFDRMDINTGVVDDARAWWHQIDLKCKQVMMSEKQKHPLKYQKKNAPASENG